MTETTTDAELGFWESGGGLVSIDSKTQFSDGRALGARIGVRNDSGVWTRKFHQGERAHFYFEFEILGDIRRPAAGVEIVDSRGIVVHGKDLFQLGLTPLPKLERGDVFRCHIWLDLRLCPGAYSITVGLVGTDDEACEGYLRGSLEHQQFASSVREHCRVTHAISLEVTFQNGGKLSHHGVADLPGGGDVNVARSTAPAALLMPEANGLSTIFHITHWKAGSQWIYRILAECAPGRIVEPELREAQVRYYPIKLGHVYPTVYLTKREFEKAAPPPGSKRFVVIRDLRDTLVSGYFSYKLSHPVLDEDLRETRAVLCSCGEEEGLLYLLDRFLPACAAIQLSWLESGERVLKYEDLLTNDVELLERVLIDDCGLAVERQRLREVVLANRFENLTGGRKRGGEEMFSHERKGVAGDWRNHFSPRVKAAFNARYGGLLVAAGYERDLSW